MTETRRQQCRAAQARYHVSPKGRAVQARYWASPKGRATDERRNGKRLFVGRRYLGRVGTIDQATALNAHIKEKLLGFIAGQSARAQAESVSTGPVPPQTAA